MNREIKFRAKTINEGEWVFGDLEHNPLSGITRIHSYRNGGHYQGQKEVNPDTVCQFTGLQDINGTEIYEGDILICKGKYLYRVEWATDGFFIRGKTYGGITSIKSFLPHQRKVIGNIFDNPELVKRDPNENE